MDSDDILSNFRQEWHREIETSTNQRVNISANEIHTASTDSNNSGSIFTSNSSDDAYQSDIERKAADLFTRGVQLEQNGQLYESITYYKRAITLVPDIEFRVHRQTINRDENSNSASLASSDCDDDADVDSSNCNDLVSKFGNLLCDSRPLCTPNFPHEITHISCLPAEMFEKIFSWIVTKELDLESLDCLGRVSRGFFLLSRKPDLWRRACFRVWGIEAGDFGVYKSWREMFIWRPRPRFNGCYIARTTYFRSGENSFQDHSYQPWHIVCYYRYFRFFANGSVLMLTSSDEPQSVVGHLKKMESKHPHVLSGHYCLHGSSLTLLFRRNPTRKKHRFLSLSKGTTDVQETTLQMEMEVKPLRHRAHWQLWWKCYSVVSSYASGEHQTSVVDVTDTNSFPPLSFSKVRSYSAETEEPLP